MVRFHLASNLAAVRGKCGLDSTVLPESAIPRNLYTFVDSNSQIFLGTAESGETVEFSPFRGGRVRG